MLRIVGVRHKLLSCTLGTLRSVGGFSLVRNSYRRRNSLLILCYHGLSLGDEHEWQPSLFMTVQQFRSRLRYLRDAEAAVLPLGQALEMLRQGSLPPRSVVITFDDGFVDFAQNALPALSEFGFPSTLYLTTHYCKYRIPISNLVLDYVLWKSGHAAVELPEYGIDEPMLLGNLQHRREVLQHLRHWMDSKKLDTAGKDEVARQIAKSLGVDYAAIHRRRMVQILSPEEVGKISKAGVDVQLHTHRHRIPLDPALFTKEIEDNRRAILEFTGRMPVHFCYPSGFYSAPFASWLKICGVKSATTCQNGLALRRSDQMKLPRLLDDSNLDDLRFESAVSGLLV